MNKQRFFVMLITLMCMGVTGLLARGTPSGVVISNATKSGGQVVDYKTGTSPGVLSGMFTNVGKTTNSGYVDGSPATVNVTTGYDLSITRFTNSLTNNSAMAGGEVRYGGYVTNNGNLSANISFQVTNLAGSVIWSGTNLTFYTNGGVATGVTPVSNLSIVVMNVPVSGVVKFLLKMKVPLLMASGSTNTLIFRVSDGSSGDAWPSAGAIAPATQDIGNLRDNQSAVFVARIQGPYLKLSRKANVGSVRPNSLIVYTIWYTNMGSANATNVTIKDFIPATVKNPSNFRISINSYLIGSFLPAGSDASNIGSFVKFHPNGGSIHKGEYGMLEYTVRVK